jgi:single-strand DNA-binding protein
LTRDPQLKYLPTTNTAVAEFGIAVNRKWKAPTGEDREEVCFVDCSAFGKTGELINQYFQKGKPIFVEGRLKLDQWEDKQGGGKRSKLSVVVENFQFIGGRDGAGPGGPGGGGGYDEADAGAAPPRSAPRSAPPPNRAAPNRPASAPRPPAEQAFGDEEQFKDDDIPF